MKLMHFLNNAPPSCLAWDGLPNRARLAFPANFMSRVNFSVIGEDTRGGVAKSALHLINGRGDDA